jgi:type IV pilus assembly protein PilA
MKTTKKGFTLIELLVVVAIIGILAAVGTPIFQGFMATAKINATKENHTRAKDMVAAYVAKCSTGTSTIALKTNSTTAFANIACSSSAGTLAQSFASHFTNDGWKNPYASSTSAVTYKNGNPAKGGTFLYYSGSTITIKTNISNEAGANIYLDNSVLKE